MNRTKLLAAFALALAIPLIAWAGSNSELYNPMPAVPATYRGGALDGADATTLGTPLDDAGSDASVRETLGNPNLAISARFFTASATSTLSVVKYQKTSTTFTYLSHEDLLFTGDATVTDAAGLFPAQERVFDTAGATHYEIRITDPSSGSLTLVPWVYGAQTQ